MRRTRVHLRRYSTFFVNGEWSMVNKGNPNLNPFTIHHSPFTFMQYFKAGKLVAVHGLKGELILKHELGKKTSLKDLKAIFIEDRKDSFIPWFIETSKARSANEILLKLETVNTRESAAKLSQKEVWLTEEDFKRLSAKSAPANLLGYTIINNKERLSEILEVVEQPHQLLCRIELNKKEVLIPINESFLKKIDHKKKEVIVELPDGLLEVYS